MLTLEKEKRSGKFLTGKRKAKYTQSKQREENNNKQKSLKLKIEKTIDKISEAESCSSEINTIDRPIARLRLKRVKAKVPNSINETGNFITDPATIEGKIREVYEEPCV